MSESKIQRYILDYLEAARILHWRVPLGPVMHSGIRKRNPMRGFPDLMGILPHTNGKVFFIECKGEKGKLSEYQIIMHKKLRAENCLVIVANELDEVKYFIEPHLRKMVEE